MIVACKNDKCYYFDRGFCSNEVTAIDKNGMCEAVWWKGQPKPPIKEGRRMPIHILNVIKREKEFNEDEYVVPEEKIEEQESSGNGAYDSGFAQAGEGATGGFGNDVESSDSDESADGEYSGEPEGEPGDSGESEEADSGDEGADDGDSGED